VIAVADSSPLVILAELGCLDFLNRVFSRVRIPNEVHFEVVSAGAGLLRAQEVSQAECLEFKSIQRYLTEIARLRAAEVGRVNEPNPNRAYLRVSVLAIRHRHRHRMRLGLIRHGTGRYWR
jgi:hypothetical protein